ncbi:hypothetical protein Ga0100230_005530 [Opitutaceae bacterium TAV3]|nr:hypothetical protein Ga0100230_005530 [Opitutaceae bacterium TAV3]
MDIPPPPRLSGKGLEKDTEKGSIHDYGRGLEIAGDDPEGEGSDGLDRFRKGEGDYERICASGTGAIVPDKVFEGLRKRREEMDAQTIELAKTADSTGRYPESPFYFGENWAGRCTLICPFSRTELPMPAVRRVASMPSFAAMQRSKMLRDVTDFIDARRERSRMYTITSGPRKSLLTIREGVKGFHRFLSKMAAHEDLKMFGAQFQWRATEFGSPKWNPETGQLELHLHAHVLMTEPESMSPKRRRKLRRRLWKLFKVHWDDAGRIENVREFVKYPVKPGDLDTIRKEGGPGALMDFFDQVKGLHLVQPMGDLRRERGKRRHAAERLHRTNDLDARMFETVTDWNAGKRPFAARNENRERIMRHRLFLALTDLILAPHRIFPWIDAERAKEAEETAANDTGNRRETAQRSAPRIANRVIARLAPAPYGSPVAEPAVVVWGWNGDWESLLREPKVRALMQHKPSYDAAVDARALITRVCAGAPAPAASQSSQRSNNCPGADPLEWLILDESPPNDGQNDEIPACLAAMN